jgi:hypothetical protein
VVQVHQPDVLDQLAVFFADLERLRHWVPCFRWRFLEPAYGPPGLTVPADPVVWTRFLTDPVRAAYRAYGLGRNSMLRVYGPRIL